MKTTINLEAPADLLDFYKKVGELQDRVTHNFFHQFQNLHVDELFSAKIAPGIPLVKRIKLPVDYHYVFDLFRQIVDAATRCLGNADGTYLKFENEVYRSEEFENILTGEHRQKGTKFLNQGRSTVFSLFSELSVRPILRALAKTTENLSHLDRGFNICPICGRKPDYAVRTGEGLELVCISCFSQWRYGYLQCCHCGTTDHSFFIELIPEEVSGYKVRACNYCKGYIKIFDQNVSVGIDKQLFDISTVYLDMLAIEHGFKKETMKPRL